MTRDEFCKYHWDYYLVLEKDFLEIERYISFDLGDNYLYNIQSVTDAGNSNCFSNEFIKQYQAICSEIDVILKSICAEINTNSTADKMPKYTDEILSQFPNLPQQKVQLYDYELQPFINWTSSPNYNAPDWWSPYNKVKHERLLNYKQANLKNTLNALAALYILEQYLVKFIGDRDNCEDVPNDISHIFEMLNYTTRTIVSGKNTYVMTAEDVEQIWNSI